MASSSDSESPRGVLSKVREESRAFCHSGKRFLLKLPTVLIRPLPYDHRKDIAIEKCSDGSVLTYGFLRALIRFLKKGGWDAVVKMRINDKEIPGFSIPLSKLKDKLQNGELKHPLTPDELNFCTFSEDDENFCIFNKLQDGKNKIVFYAEDRPKVMIKALTYRGSWNSTGHTRSCFNGAQDIIFVEDESDGSLRSFGWFLSLSNSSKCLRMAEGTTDVAIRINGHEVPYFSIKLDRLRRKTMPMENLTTQDRRSQKPWRGVPMVELMNPQENKQIYEHLHEGRNNITFHIKGHPDSEIHARIYNWSRNSKVVIVDIDGTVTKSNGMGMVKNFTEEYYLQPGISRLLLYIKVIS
ncbi:hypothetical protein KC19_11G149700 [Ceratodon purpureus]|uniref:Lipin/Ned1/Smp2 (LNS2) domain-containing protein n=1 Tax=Ceratodon purpureus TaxID=3225 RepID=A0A8T0GFA2_CERPU|nr:hypothetical protein KC19_11G149700 [Ceratodon purpureus]